jgi:hypothetical protein
MDDGPDATAVLDAVSPGEPSGLDDATAVIDREAEPAPATPGSPPSEHTLVTERPAAPDAPAAPSEAVPVVGLRFGQ